MSKLSRVFQKLFGLNGDQSHFGQFGSRAANTPLLTKDPNSLQALSAFTNNGWLDAINVLNKAPFLEDMNGLFLLAFYQIAYGHQEGIPEWNASTPYFTGSIVKKTGTFELYGSSIDNNIGNALPSQANDAHWQYLNPSSIPAGTIVDYAAGAAPAGWLACDGSYYVVGQYPSLYANIGNTWGGTPGVNFAVPTLQGRSTIGAGQGLGLSNRVMGTYIGEENHVLAVGEMPSHAHIITDPGHTHLAGLNGGSDYGGYNTPTLYYTGNNHATSSSGTGITINNSGGGGGHNNMQPSAVVQKIIKY